MPSLWFVTPAFERFELVEICLDQRLQVMYVLRNNGIDAQQVVVADDANLKAAQDRGMHVVKQNNKWLGRKFNDGQQYAGEHGADWIVPIGSDSWVDPRYFLPLPAKHLSRTSGMYAPVTPTKIAELNVGLMGAGPHMWHKSLLAPRHFRPAPDEINRNTDSSSIAGLPRPPRWEWKTIHSYQYVGFRVAPYITQYDMLFSRWGVKEHDNPFEVLADHYDPALVERVQRLMCRS